MINFTIGEISQCYNFANAMRGNHNPNLIQQRKDWEIFRDDFRGKLGEIAVRKYISEKIPTANITTDLDFEVTPRGQWDVTDLEVDGQSINVKSIKENSQFLLVECNRYDEHGNYRYNNNDGEQVRIDYYVLVRVYVKPEVNRGIFRGNNLNKFMNNAWDAKNQCEVRRVIYAEVLGGISHEEFLREKSYAPRGIKCSTKNLRAIIQGTNIDNLPDRITGNEFQNSILQQDNYVIDSTCQLHKLERIL